MSTQQDLQAILDAKVKEIRGRRELTPIAQRARIAAAWKPLKAEADQRDKAAKEERAATIQSAKQTALGVAHLAKTPGDAALVSMARRQADKEVATVESAAQAAKLLQHAIDSGDPTMVIAIRERAFEQSGFGLADPGWAQVASDSVADNPQAFNAMEVLLAERSKGLLAGAFDNLLVAPSELGNATDFEVERYIGEDPSVAQAGAFG